MPELRQYQREGVDWLVATIRQRGAALLADEMGLGKSCQAIAVAARLEVQCPLVVCPAIVLPHWLRQIELWNSPQAWRALSYEGFVRASKGSSKKIEPLGEHDLVIFDECHYLMTPGSQRSNAAKVFASGGVKYKLGLSGTPMTARPRDLWNPLDTLFRGAWGSWWWFTTRYCNGHYRSEPNAPRGRVWDTEGASHQAELHERLSHVMLRRTKSEVLAELPPRTRVPIDVTLKTRPMLGGDIGSLGTRDAVSQALSNCEPLKIPASLSLVRELLAEGARPLILTTRKATAEGIAAELECPFVHGEIPAAQRRARIADAPVAVATMYSVTTGIDLVGFDCAIFVGLDWVPSTLLQAEARIHRIGQDKPVTVYYLCAQGTVDEAVRARVIERLDTFSEIIGGGDEAALARDLSAQGDLLAQLLQDVKALHG